MVAATKRIARGRRRGLRKYSRTPAAAGKRPTHAQRFKSLWLLGRPTALMKVSKTPMNTAERNSAVYQFSFFKANISVQTMIPTTPNEMSRIKITGDAIHFTSLNAASAGGKDAAKQDILHDTPPVSILFIVDIIADIGRLGKGFLEKDAGRGNKSREKYHRRNRLFSFSVPVFR